MSDFTAVAVGRPEIPPRKLTPRLRSQLVYFMTVPGAAGVPDLLENEFWFDPTEVARWLDDGVIDLVSPLDTANMTEVELSEEQESFLEWLQSKQVAHVRVLD